MLEASVSIANRRTKNFCGTGSATKDPAKGSVAPFAGFVAQGVRSVPETELKSWVTAALKQVTSHEDTHPSLTDRLKAMGAPAEFAPPGPGEGAEKLLGSSLARLEKKFDAAWNKLAAREARPYFPEAPRR
jgi:hypothetical protein